MIHQKLNGMAFPVRAVRVGISVMIALIAASMWLNWKVGQSQSAAIAKEVAVVTTAQKVYDYGLLLETTVKAAVVNGDPEAAAQYRTLQPELRDTLTALREELDPDGLGLTVSEVDQADLALISIEYEALELASRGKFAAASQLIHSSEYDRLVRVYEEGIHAVQRSASGYVRATQERIKRYRLWLTMLSGGSLVLVVIGWFSFVRPARRWGDQLDIARATAELAMAQLRDKQVELEELNQRLYTQARVDPLTGLNTRLSFNEDAQGVIGANPAPNHYCAVMCDVDFFKQYNDSCGHLAGDRVLRLVADALKSAGRAEDRFYRLGGEEFLVVMKAASLGAAGLCADRMRAAVEALRLVHPGSKQGLVTISMGVAELDFAGGMSIEQWLNDADTALYDAKASGRNRVRLANEQAIGQPDVEAPALHVVPTR
jgi:diguanylate cyclase (GGDEF)-like protein